MTKKNDSHRRSRGEDKHQESAPTPTAESAESGPAAAAPSAANPAAESAEPAAVPTTSAPPPEDQQLLRLRADFENYRKRVLRERDELYQRANADLITELLPTLDHLDIAFAAVEVGSDDPVVQGFRLVGEQMRGVLGRFGLKTVDADQRPQAGGGSEAGSRSCGGTGGGTDRGI